MTTEESSAGWAFVLQHFRLIERYSQQHYHPALTARGTSADDFRQELVLDVVEHISGYDPTRSAPATWLWWRARQVRSRALRRVKWQEFPGANLPPCPDARQQAAMELQATCALLLRRATALEAEAVQSVMRGEKAPEVLASLGVSMATRRSRLAGLGRRLQGELDARVADFGWPAV